MILRKYISDLKITKAITVGNNVYIGVRIIIMPGFEIDNNIIVRGTSVVTKDIPVNSVTAGVPARRGNLR